MGMELTNITRPADRIGSARIIWTCKCVSKAYDYTTTRRFRFVDQWGATKWTDAVLTREVNGVMRDVSHDYTCPDCKRARKSARVQGHTTDHKCNAKCLASKGPVCECSCGGANHGSSYL